MRPEETAATWASPQKEQSVVVVEILHMKDILVKVTPVEYTI
jgi:hypothetical protein